MYRTSGSKLKS